MAHKKLTKKQRQWSIILVMIVLLMLGYCVSIHWLTHREENAYISKEAFIEKIAPQAQKLQQRYHVPASISLAQAALESDFGRSELSRKYYNLYGVKAFGIEPGISLSTKEYLNGQWYEMKQRFRVYVSWQSSMRDHARLMANGTTDNPQRYLKVLQATNYREAALALQEAGYATDPSYADKLVNLIETYQLNRYD